MKVLYIKLLVLVLLFGCDGSRNKVKIAPEITYHFEVKCGSAEPRCQELKRFLDQNIPRYKYTITNQSGKKWPFYQAFEKNVSIPIDSLMPPHWQVHRFVQKKEGKNIHEGEFVVEFDIFSIPDTIPNFNVTIYKMEYSGLSLSATSGIHFVSTSPKDSTLSVQETFLMSLLRYSFK